MSEAIIMSSIGSLFLLLAKYKIIARSGRRSTWMGNSFLEFKK